MPVESLTPFLLLPPLDGQYAAVAGGALASAVLWLARTKETAIERERKDARSMYEALQTTSTATAGVAAAMAALQTSNKDSVETIRKQTEIIDRLRSELAVQAADLARFYAASQDTQRWGREVITEFRREMERFGHDHQSFRESLSRLEAKLGAA